MALKTASVAKRQLYVVFGKNLVKVRTGLGMTQEKAAEKAGISFRFFQDLEAGISAPSLPTLTRLVRAFDCDFTDLLKGCEAVEEAEIEAAAPISKKKPKK